MEESSPVSRIINNAVTRYANGVSADCSVCSTNDEMIQLYHIECGLLTSSGAGHTEVTAERVYTNCVARTTVGRVAFVEICKSINNNNYFSAVRMSESFPLQ